MSQSGDNSDDLLIRARSTLLDALEALEEQREALIVVGAQAIYLQTGDLNIALAPATKDSDLSFDPRLLHEHPRLEEAMRGAGFFPDEQPGSWVRFDGIPVDLMVPDQLAGHGRRSVRIPPHDNRSARKTRGLEASLIDYDSREITSLTPHDARRIHAKVAGPGALLVAKVHKITERIDTPTRLNDKDAHDAFRLLRSVETQDLTERFVRLMDDTLTQETTKEALSSLVKNFASGADALGSAMAGRAEAGVGDPQQTSLATALLADDLVNAIAHRGITIT